MDIDKLTLSDVVKQLHVIVGDGGRCMCGVYGGVGYTCAEILALKSEDVRRALMMANCGGTRITEVRAHHFTGLPCPSAT